MMRNIFLRGLINLKMSRKSIAGYEEEYKPKKDYHMPKERKNGYEEEYKPKKDYDNERYKNENKISPNNNGNSKI